MPAPFERTLPDRLIPEQVVADILAELPTQSVVRALARNMPLSSRVARMVVPGEVAQANWVSGDLGMKRLTKFGFADLDLVVEELAAIVVIPNAFVDDANVPLWDYARTELTNAFARKIDLAFLFGIDRPATTGDSVWEIADAAGNVFASDQLVSGMLELLATVPNVTGIAAQRQFPYAVAAQNTSALWFDPTGAAGINLYGLPTAASLPGGWDPTKASALAGNWQNAILGIREDLTFQMFDQGVLTDTDGSILVNLMQQDAQALRAVMRVAWAVRPDADIDVDGNRIDVAPFGAVEPITIGGGTRRGATPPQQQAPRQTPPPPTKAGSGRA